MSLRTDTHTPLLNTEDVAKWLGVAARTICLWAESGQIPAVKMGRQWRFREQAVREWLDAREAKAKLGGKIE
jgi:excisionase family DNA binding protein